MMWRVEIKDRAGIFDSAGAGACKDIQDLGIHSVHKVCVSIIYTLEGDIDEGDVQTISRELLADRIVQEYAFSSNFPASNTSKDVHGIEIAYNPGVMDPVETSTLKGIRDLGIQKVNSVRTSKKYLLHGSISKQELETIIAKALCNKLIQHVVSQVVEEKSVKEITSRKRIVQIKRVDILNASDEKLRKLSRDGQLFLNLNEMRAIQSHFKSKKCNPTDCELETIAQTWSEHCVHKTFRGKINYTEIDGKNKKTSLIDNLLKSTIVKATKEINKSWCVSVFHDNAGVIEFDGEDCVCFKAETHNHPSALEPFGGANTGVGGVIRDILGTGLGAKPIANTDVFCFAPPDMPFKDVPQGALHPKRIMKGVVAGVRDYGNKMGIPTVNGAIVFDKGFLGNPLVYCGTVGMIPRNKVNKQVKKGDLVVVVGGRTGRDGIHGATFSSGELTHESEVVSSGAVQIGNPIEEKKILDALLEARDKNLYTSVTDCGAGGLSSAVGEMGKELGARVDLEKVPLKYEGLNYDEIWISESQERMVLSVPKEKVNELLEVFKSENSEATVIGEFTGTKRLELFFEDKKVCDLDMDFLHDGIPQIAKDAVWAKPKINEPNFQCPQSLTKKLKGMLSNYNVASKEWVIRQYDHEVQGMGVVKPLMAGNSPSDASVLRPKLNSKKGIAVSNGINVRFGMIDPYWMAASCIDEAIRQIISVGGSLEKIAILDNFCWGNPDKPDRLGGLVRCAKACYDIAKAYGVPFISGKDSLNNEYAVNGKSLAIPGTILISAIGIMDDVEKAVTMDFKKEGNLIYVIGDTFAEMGGSIYFETLRFLGNSVPKVDAKKGVKIFNALSKAVEKELIAAAHDISEGGLAVALAEMAFSGNIGAKIDLKKVPYSVQRSAYSEKTKYARRRTQDAIRNDFLLFSETNSRFIVEVEKKNQKAFERLFKGIPFGLAGLTEAKKELTIVGVNERICVSSDIASLKKSWQKPLNW